jgi:hypothetical protein
VENPGVLQVREKSEEKRRKAAGRKDKVNS